MQIVHTNSYEYLGHLSSVDKRSRIEQNNKKSTNEFTQKKCFFCDYKGNEYQLNNHYKQKHPEKIAGCRYCGMIFPGKKQLLDHSKVKHKSCKFCDFIGEHLKLHYKNFHTDKVFFCKFCDKSFFQKTQYDEHLINEHSKCKYCGYSGENLENHYKSYHTENIKKCPYCDVFFYNEFMLENHINEFHPKLTICPMCDYKNNNEDKIREHVFKYHEESYYKIFPKINKLLSEKGKKNGESK